MSLLDKLITEVDYGLKALLVRSQATRPNPASNVTDLELEPASLKQSQGFMRVDHTGEICAQALYRGQALLAKDAATRQHLLQAADEENDHLSWCADRLEELNTHASFLNPFWYSASFLIGVTAAAFGDKISLGFVEETENQVEGHLDHHLANLSTDDLKSRAILDQMRIDEIEHAEHARNRGAAKLPKLVQGLMKAQSQVMTKTAYLL